MSILDSLQQFHAGTLSEAATWRLLLGHPDWHVAVTEHNHACLYTVEGTQYVAAQAAPDGPTPETAHWMRMSGRHLVRHLPAEAEGIGFELGAPHGIRIAKAQSAEALAEWVSVLEVEAALAEPGVGQAALFLAHTWWVLWEGEAPGIFPLGPLRVVRLFTAEDQLDAALAAEGRAGQGERRRVPGQALFAHLAQLPGYDAVLINDDRDRVDHCGPHFAAALLKGLDTRPGCGHLRARSTAEIHLFLDLAGMYRADRTQQLAYLGGALCARYEGAIHGGARRTYLFEPVTPLADPHDLGPGASAILCAGALANALQHQLGFLAQAATPEEAAPLAVDAARWALELKKMLPDGADRLPRAVLRDTWGARYARENPEVLTRAWIEAALELSGRTDASPPGLSDA